MRAAKSDADDNWNRGKSSKNDDIQGARRGKAGEKWKNERKKWPS